MKKNIVSICIICLSSFAFSQQALEGTRFYKTPNAKYVGEAATTSPKFDETNSCWKVIKITTNGIYNLSLNDTQGYIAKWSEIENYSTNSSIAVWK